MFTPGSDEDLQANPLETLVNEHPRWQNHNFPGWLETPMVFLLGITEEVGELAGHVLDADDEGIQDDVGDILVFLAGYCRTQDWVLTDLVSLDWRYSDWMGDAHTILVRLFKQVGLINHGHLKKTQGIRGDTDTHIRTIRSAVHELVGMLCVLGESWGFNVGDCIAKTWARVRQRDWSKDAVSGGDKGAVEWESKTA